MPVNGKRTAQAVETWAAAPSGGRLDGANRSDMTSQKVCQQWTNEQPE